MDKKPSSVEAVIEYISRIMNIAGIVVLAIIMVITVGDVIMRYVFTKPIIGSAEIATNMMAFMCLGMGWCMIKGKSIKMDLIVERWPPRAQAAVDMLTYALSLVLLGFMTWRIFLEAGAVQRSYLVTATIRMPIYPFHYVMLISALFLTIAVFVNLVKNAAKVVKR